MNVTLVYASAPRTVHEHALDAPEPCTAEQALALSGWLQRFPDIGAAPLLLSVWGKKVSPGSPLREGDRLEVLRPLRVDPKVARRERFVGQGARSAGLFARRRPGAKPGY